MADISYGDDAPKAVNIIIEIQKGNVNKYEIDKQSGRLFLDRVNGTSSMGYPTDYGYVPDTLCEISFTIINHIENTNWSCGNYNALRY